MANTVVLRQKAPTTTSIMGETIPHPEFVGTSCDVDGCENYGYCAETALDVGTRAEREGGTRLVKLCWECAPEDA